jgi:Cu/Zn superoxide dismutase
MERKADSSLAIRKATLACAMAIAVLAGTMLKGSPLTAAEGDVVVKLHPVSRKGVDARAEFGTVTLAADPKGGVGFSVLASGLPQGNHFVELHSGGSCAPGKVNGRTTAAGAAGSVYAPKGAKVIQSDNARGFTGRLPDIEIGADGTGNVAGSVQGVSMSQLAGRTIIIQGQGNNTLDPLAPMATQRGRLACGVIPRT